MHETSETYKPTNRIEQTSSLEKAPSDLPGILRKFLYDLAKNPQSSGTEALTFLQSKTEEVTEIAAEIFVKPLSLENSSPSENAQS